MPNYRRLPPMPALVAFECAARLGNFTKAGAELGITRVAISRHVREVERRAGAALFDRHDNMVRLTPAGLDLYAGVSRGLDEVASALAATTAAPKLDTIRVSMTSACYAFWLAPLLDAFQSANPQTRLQLAIVEQDRTTYPGEHDVSVRFGPATSPGFTVEHLADELVFPVCAPSYLGARAGIDPADMAQERLLDLGAPYAANVNWQHWLELAGAPCRDLEPRMAFNLYSAYVHAALAGQGVALLGPPIVGAALRSGMLVAASARPPLRSGAFYLVWRKGRAGAAINRLADWLLSRHGTE